MGIEFQKIDCPKTRLVSVMAKINNLMNIGFLNAMLLHLLDGILLNISSMISMFYSLGRLEHFFSCSINDESPGEGGERERERV